MHARLCLIIIVVSATTTAASAQQASGNMLNPLTQEAITLMMGFAKRTGLMSDRPRRRYLWTDAFAVCNFLGLARLTGEGQYEEFALRLIEQVHHTLGRQRGDDRRSGWISGLSEAEGEAHPTRGGLRIGKEFAERAPDECFDERLEWDRDGQYFHYLTKWMHALDQVTRSTGLPRLNQWARELASTGCNAFTYVPSASGGVRRMYWKMSIDLSRPLVSSMGQHDPLDGYVTALQLESTEARPPDSVSEPSLEHEISQFAAMIESEALATADPLGLGGLLTDAYRLEQLIGQGAPADRRLLETLLAASLKGLHHYARSGDQQLPANQRLAFRELGLAIGLRGAERLWHAAQSAPARALLSDGARTRLKALMQYAPLGQEIEAFWREPEHRNVRTWVEHRDINEVMLATSLAPDGFLVLLSPD